jgi:hypothetical protein
MTAMRKLLLALVLGYCGSVFAAYPAGIWSGATHSLNTRNAASVDLLVLPNGTFRGQILIGPDPGYDDVCVMLIIGSFVHGGTWAAIARSSDGDISQCSVYQGGGGAIGVQHGNSLKFTISTTAVKGTVTLSLDSADYNKASSLKLIAGHWTNGLTGAVEHVLSTGAFTRYEPVTGCTSDGKYTVVDPKHNLYSYTETLSGCGFPKWNGVTLDGIATIYGSGSSKWIQKQAAWGALIINDPTEGDLFYEDLNGGTGLEVPAE